MENNSIPPSAWIKRFAHLVPAGGRVLDVAAGGGRHSAFFLALGHPVTAVDRDTNTLTQRLAQARDIEIIAADLEDGSPWPLQNRQFSAVIVCNYLFRPIMAQIRDSVAPGGVLIYETFAQGHERLGRPRNPDFLLRDGELLQIFAAGLQVVAYEYGQNDDPAPAIKQRICAVNAGH
jgi:SAM-dependent methyltransferase